MSCIDEILRSYGGTTPRILATVVELVGSGYGRPGARMLIEPDGTYVGAISGGCLERDVVRNARALAERGPTTAVFDTRSGAFAPAGPYGTGCEGLASIGMRPFRRNSRPLSEPPRRPSSLASKPGASFSTPAHPTRRSSSSTSLHPSTSSSSAPVGMPQPWRASRARWGGVFASRAAIH
jgi:xanthine/CO dehydrogenase XdhC/CoxF family maturation factor